MGHVNRPLMIRPGGLPYLGPDGRGTLGGTEPGRPPGSVAAMTIIAPPTADVLAERLFGDMLATLDLACVHLGQRLGLYAALQGSGALTAAEVADRAGTDERYTREWLEQQAAAGVLGCPDPDAAPAERRFALPEGYEPALLDPDSLVATEGVVRVTLGALSTLPQL